VRLAEAAGPALAANKAEGTSVSKTKIAKLNDAEAAGSATAKKLEASKIPTNTLAANMAKSASIPKDNVTAANVTSTVAMTVEARCAEAAGGAEVKKIDASKNHVSPRMGKRKKITQVEGRAGVPDSVGLTNDFHCERWVYQERTHKHKQDSCYAEIQKKLTKCSNSANTPHSSTWSPLCSHNKTESLSPWRRS